MQLVEQERLPEELCRPAAAHALVLPVFQQMKMDRMNQMNSDGNVSHPQGQAPPSSFSAAGGPGGPPGQQGFPLNMPPQQMGPPMAPGNMQPPFMPPGQMGPHSGGMMGPPDMQGLQGMQRHSGPPRNMGPQGPHGMVPRGMQGPPPPRGMGPRDPQGPPHQGNMIQHGQGGMMGPPSRTHGNMPNNYGMQGPPGGLHGSQGNVQGPPESLQAPPYMQHQVGSDPPTDPGPVSAASWTSFLMTLTSSLQNSGPAMHSMGGQGPGNKGKATPTRLTAERDVSKVIFGTLARRPSPLTLF